MLSPVGLYRLSPAYAISVVVWPGCSLGLELLVLLLTRMLHAPGVGAELPAEPALHRGSARLERWHESATLAHHAAVVGEDDRLDGVRQGGAALVDDLIDGEVERERVEPQHEA
jgi:hypothetical protein